MGPLVENVVDPGHGDHAQESEASRCWDGRAHRRPLAVEHLVLGLFVPNQSHSRANAEQVHRFYGYLQRANLESLFEEMCSYTNLLLDQMIKEQKELGSVDVFRWFRLTAFDVIGTCPCFLIFGWVGRL